MSELQLPGRVSLDLAPAFVALDARVQTSKRLLAAGELFAASVAGSTVLDEDEIVLAVRVPLPGPGDGNVFQKFRERKSVDFPVVNLAVHLSVADGLVTDARLCAGAVAPVPLRLGRRRRRSSAGGPTSGLRAGGAGRRRLGPYARHQRLQAADPRGDGQAVARRGGRPRRRRSRCGNRRPRVSRHLTRVPRARLQQASARLD